MTGSEFLSLVQARGLMAAAQVERLRQKLGPQLDQATAKGIAKFLVDKELLSLADAQALLSAAAKAPAPKPTAVEDEFGLAPLEEEGLLPQSAPQPAPRPTAQPPAAKAPASRPAKPSKPADPQPAAPAAPQTNSLLDDLEDLGPLESAGLSAASPLDALAQNAATANPLLGGAPAKRRFGWGGGKEPKKRKKGENQFDSPLMLFGGGGLLLLSIVGVLLLFLYLRGSGDEQFRLAEEDYRAGSYTQAITKYSSFLEKYATHPKASTAKVHRGLAQLRQAVEQNKDFPHALEVARKVIPEMENEREFADARVEFRSLLPTIAEGLANDAAKQKEPAQIREKLQAAEQALALVMNTNYVAQSARPMQRITTIRETMTLAQRELDRDADLQQTITSIEAAAQQGNVADAYRHRRQLLKSYPDLAANEKLVAAIDAVAQRELSAIVLARDERPVATQTVTSPILASWALVEPRLTAADNGAVAAILVEGALYGIDSGSGKVMWRHFVGGRGNLSPVDLPGSGPAHVIAAAPLDQQLLRLDPRTGQIVWRQSLASEPVGIAVAPQTAVVTSGQGEVALIELASGKQLAQAKLPQNLRTGAVVHPSGNAIYQVGDQASIYVFSPQLECLQAFYLGHDPGSVRMPPIALARHLIVPENRGSAAAALNVLKLDEQGKIEGPVQRVDLPGLVVTTPVLAERRLVVVTNRGHVKVLEINPANLEAPLVEIADQPALARSEPLARHLALESGNLWMADNHLVRYRVQAAAGRLMPAPLADDYENGSYASAPKIVGDIIIHARRSTREAATLVCGTSLSDGKRLWETALAISPVGAPLMMPDQMAAISASGGVFEGVAPPKGTATNQIVAGKPWELAPGETPLRLAGRIDQIAGMVVCAPRGDDNRLLAISLKGQSGLGEQKLLTLPEPLACLPAAWGKGIAAPTSVGQVFWINPANGKPVAAPFQPEVSPGSARAWTTPAASKSGSELLITDGQRIYLIALEREPAPHLAARVQSAEFQVPLRSPLAVLGDRVLAVDDGGTLHALDVASLEVVGDSRLAGPAVWGPVAVDSAVLIATSEGTLECVAADMKPLWQWKHPTKALAVGNALVEANAATVAFGDGQVVQFNLADGRVLQSASLGQPLASGPVVVNKALAVAAADGTILLFTLSTNADAAAGGEDTNP